MTKVPCLSKEQIVRIAQFRYMGALEYELVATCLELYARLEQKEKADCACRPQE